MAVKKNYNNVSPKQKKKLTRTLSTGERKLIATRAVKTGANWGVGSGLLTYGINRTQHHAAHHAFKWGAKVGLAAGATSAAYNYGKIKHRAISISKGKTPGIPIREFYAMADNKNIRQKRQKMADKNTALGKKYA